MTIPYTPRPSHNYLGFAISFDDTQWIATRDDLDEPLSSPDLTTLYLFCQEHDFGEQP